MADGTVDAAERSEMESIAVLVEEYLARHQPPDYRIVVRRGAIRRGARRWLVEVGVERAVPPISASDFVDRISKANEELDKDLPRFVRLTQLVPRSREAL